MDDTGTVRLPHDVRSAGAVRRRVGADLGSHGFAPVLTADAVLVLSELVGNSIRHANPLAGGELEISWDMSDQGVELRVTDGGSPRGPQLRDADADDVGGRGLTIVTKLAASWGVETTSLGTTVWALVNGSRGNGQARLA
ncbi:MAG: ATP-binding protein [Mycobacteriales bacterium]